MSIRALLLFLISAAAHGLEVNVPATQLEYTQAQPGNYCANVYVTDFEGDESGPSNTVCKSTPATWRWQAPTEYTNGQAIGAGELVSYRLVFNDQTVLSRVENFVAGTWAAEAQPPMTITVVQSKSSNYGTATSIAFDSAPTEGNLLLAMHAHRSAEQASVMASSGWTQIFDKQVLPTNTTYRRAGALYAKKAGASESSTVSLNFGSNSQTLVIAEFNAGTGREWDAVTGAVQATGDNGATTDGTSTSTGATASTSNQLGVIFGAFKSNSNITAVSYTLSGYASLISVGSVGPYDIGIGLNWQEFADTAARGGTLSISGVTADYNTGLIGGVAVFGHSAAGGGLSGTIGEPSESDSALAMSRAKQKPIAQISATDTALAVNGVKSRVIGLPQGLGQALGLSRAKTRVLGLVTDTATVFSMAAPGAVGLVLQTALALPLARMKTRVIGLNAGADVALPMRAVKSRTIGIVSESDALFGVQGTSPLGLVAETDTALSMTGVLGSAGGGSSSGGASVVRMGAPGMPSGLQSRPTVPVGALQSALLVPSGKRVSVTVSIKSDQPGGVWINAKAGESERGHFLSAGAALTIEGATTEIYAYNPAAAVVRVSILEIT